MKTIDLSKLLYSDMDVFPGDPEVKFDRVHTYEKNNWELKYIQMGSHTGTHVDAFSHMHRGKETLDDMSIDKFFGESQVVSLDKDWPQKLGLFFIEEIDIEYLEKILDSNPDFIGGDITEDLERALLKRNILTYTGLVNLDLITKHKTFMFYGLPLKIKSGDGSPVRAIAIIEE